MKKRNKRKGKSRKASLFTGIFLVLFLTVWGVAGEWYVHHPRKWLNRQEEKLPSIVTMALCWMGNPLADITDALDITGHDVVYEYDTPAPKGEVFFAGAPVRTNGPTPKDIAVIDRGHFKIGWSNRLRHPVWCAYHVTQKASFDAGKRPGFLKDRALATIPGPNAYKGSGYDRGHMTPNYAIATRYGPEEQRKTFMMGNIAPQTPSLNRGVWREVEHRIADLWTARYGEIWVIVGCIPSRTGETLTGTDIDAPSEFYQVIISQEDMNIRAMAMIFPKNVSWDAWPTRYLVSIDELEKLTGLDFNPDLPSFIQDPLEAELPSRVWPIRPCDVFTQFAIRYLHD